MKRLCDRCGSANHRSFDCLRPDPGWRDRLPPEPAQAAPGPPPAASALPAPESAPGTAQARAAAALELDPPRWRGGPEVCPAENLPAFPDASAAGKFLSGSCPGYSAYRTWDCPKCGRTHVLARKGGDDAVAEAGPRMKRAGFPFMRDETRTEMARRAERAPQKNPGDLPERKADLTLPAALPKAGTAGRQEALW